jgi:adenosylhomocysteine nucleosidase
VVYDITERIGDTDEAVSHYSTVLDLSWLRRPYPIPVTETHIASADRDLDGKDITELSRKYGVAVADWESGAIAYVTQKNKTKCLILRGVSDLVDAAGGDAYGNSTAFRTGTAAVMSTLLASLPEWIAAGHGTDGM